MLMKPKYYTFDWDDNALIMPTKIYLLKNWEEVGVSTSEFATIRTNLGANGYFLLPNNESFRDFTEQWDKQFKIDSLNAKKGPSWPDFIKCINQARIFAIITARGHSREIMYETIEQMIKENHWGINRDEISKNMEIFLLQAKKINKNIYIKDDEDILLYQYLQLARFYPISNPSVQNSLWWNGAVNSPELAKEKALLDFTVHVRTEVEKLFTDSYTQQIKVWFSDDDKKTLEHMRNIMWNGSCWDNITPYLFDTSSWTRQKSEIII